MSTFGEDEGGDSGGALYTSEMMGDARWICSFFNGEDIRSTTSRTPFCTT